MEGVRVAAMQDPGMRRKLISDLKACSSARNLEQGKIIHEASIQKGLSSNIYVAGTLISMYAKCGSMEQARRVFDGLEQPNVVCWNALILGYADNGERDVALELFSRMGILPDERTFVALIKACAVKDDENDSARGKSRYRGKLLHLLVLQSGKASNSFVQSSLVDMFAKCGSMNDSRSLFETMASPDVVSWNALIMGYANNGERDMALDLFSQMGREGCTPVARTFVAVLKACADVVVGDGSAANAASKQTGKTLHLLALQSGCDLDIYVQSTLVDMYAKCGSMHDARSVFDRIEHPNLVCWNALLLGYADNGEGQVSLELFSRMGRESCAVDARTFVAALKACAEKKDRNARIGNELHLLAMECGCDSNIYVQGTLVDMYAKAGCMEHAHGVFDGVKTPNALCWTALVLGYADNGEGETALNLFTRMGREGCVPDARSFVAALKACSDLGVEGEKNGGKETSRRRGRELHLLALASGCDSDLYVQGTLVDMYSRCESMRDARRVFDRMKHRDVVCWTALLLGYADNGHGETALSMLSRMRREGLEPDGRTFVAVLKACTDLAVKEENPELKATFLNKGDALHLLAWSSGCDSDLYLKSTLVDMYAKCGSMVDAQRVFDSVKHPNVVCWNALILGYVEQGEGETALKLFARMRRQGCIPDSRSFCAALKACGTMGALETGKAFHAEIRGHTFEHDLVLRGCLVDFYAKCGSLEVAEQVFESHPASDLVSWTSLVAGYSRIGDTEGVFRIFDRMLDAGVQPNGVTFISLFTACSHAGLVEKGQHYFEVMVTRYGITPTVEHYTCMVDMLGRSNKLGDAIVMVSTMPFYSDSVAWTSILGACRKWKNVELGRLAFEALIFLNKENVGAYVLMANVYGSKGMWADQARLQAIRVSLSREINGSCKH